MFEFLKRFAKQSEEQEVTAPDNPELFLRNLEWTSVRRLDGQLQGDYKTLFRGSGLMLADLREYQLHDDVRHIDWNVTARMRTPYVREHLEDREISAWFIMDLTGSIHFGSQSVSKLELATRYVATLARLLTRHGNRVGAILYTGAETLEKGVIQPRTGRKQVLHLIQQIRNSSVTPSTGQTDLNQLFKLACSVINRRSAVFLVSDFISAPGWEAAMNELATRHDVVAARLLDPSEIDIPKFGMMLVEDIETGEQLFIDSDDRGFRERYAKQAVITEQKLRDAFSKAHVDCIELQTSEPLEQSLIRFLRLRKRKSQRIQGRLPGTSSALRAHSV